MSPKEEMFRKLQEKERLLKSPSDEDIQTVIDQTLGFAPLTVKLPLYHATTEAALKGIKESGLKAESYLTTSWQVAKDHAAAMAEQLGSKPAILKVNREAAKGLVSDLSEDYIRNRARYRYRPGQSFGDNPVRQRTVAFQSPSGIPANALKLIR